MPYYLVEISTTTTKAVRVFAPDEEKAEALVRKNDGIPSQLIVSEYDIVGIALDPNQKHNIFTRTE